MAIDTGSSERQSWVPRPPGATVWDVARHTFVAGLAAIITGIVIGGFGSRLFMRVAGAAGGSQAARRITEAGFRVGEITLGGTIALVIFVGLIGGLVGAVIYLSMRPWLDWVGSWRGVVFGVLLFGLTSATSDVMNPDNIDFRILGNQVLIVALIVAMFLAFGIMLSWLEGRLSKRLPEADGSSNGAIYLALSIVGGVLAVPLTGGVLFTTGACSCAVPMGASISFVLLLAASLVITIAGVRPLADTVTRLAAVVGWVGLAGVASFGLWRAVADAVAIIRL